MVKIIVYIFIASVLVSCIDPILKTSLENNTGENICIEQYSAPNDFCKEMKKNTYGIFDVHVHFTIIKKNKIYIYNVVRSIGNQTHKVVKNNIIRLRLNKDMSISVLSKKSDKNQSMHYSIVPKIKDLEQKARGQ